MTNDLTGGTIWKLLPLFTLPIPGGSLLQLMYSTVDGIVVGNFVSAVVLVLLMVLFTARDYMAGVDSIGYRAIWYSMGTGFALGTCLYMVRLATGRWKGKAIAKAPSSLLEK